MRTSYVDKSSREKLSRLSVLVVDDQPEIRIMVREILGDAGVSRVLEASHGRDALTLMDADFDMVNFIICDWNMPSMTGIEFLRQVRTVYADMPFLMVTGRADKFSVVEARNAGVSGFIRKPFSPGQLEEKLRVLMRGVL
jgi:CheY-like chemotaxis protein